MNSSEQHFNKKESQPVSLDRSVEVDKAEKNHSEIKRQKEDEVNSRVNSMGLNGKSSNEIDDIKKEKLSGYQRMVSEIETDFGELDESKKMIMENMKREGEAYDAIKKERDVLEYTKRELPEGEPRIKMPMRGDCKVSVCVPAYDEGKNIITSLELLAGQEVDKDSFEVVVNVNNREGASDKIISSNQETIQLLKYINDESSAPNNLSSEELSRLDKIKESGIAIHCIDKSSKGCETKPINDEDFKKVGCMQPRKRAMDEISERFLLSGKSDGIIASLDADTKVSNKWVAEIINNFENENVNMVAGERRDGLDVDREGNIIGENAVNDRLLDEWNTEQRRSEEAFRDLPDISPGLERAKIKLMGDLVGAYNFLRGRHNRKVEGKTNLAENFKGGSGKMFRVSSYVNHSKEFIKMMDAGGKKPDNMSGDKDFKYVGRQSEEKKQSTTDNDSIEALAIYPETRVRGWDVKGDKNELYADFKNLHNPFGSSGKENAYAIASVLKGEIPTTYNEEYSDIRRTMDNLIKSHGQDFESINFLQKYFSNDEINKISNIMPEELDRMKNGDEEMLEKHKDAIKLLDRFPKETNLFEALNYYGKQNDGEETFNPKRKYFETLVMEMRKNNGDVADELKDELERIYGLSRRTIEELASISDGDLRDLATKRSVELINLLNQLEEKISPSKAAQEYKNLFNK